MQSSKCKMAFFFSKWPVGRFTGSSSASAALQLYISQNMPGIHACSSIACAAQLTYCPACTWTLVMHPDYLVK